VSKLKILLERSFFAFLQQPKWKLFILKSLKLLSYFNFRDAGTPLYLTPYIESGDIETGKEMARVVDPLDGLAAGESVESYAGFFTVNKATRSNMFFWFFPATVSYDLTTGQVFKQYIIYVFF
jgi:hypothetical protein